MTKINIISGFLGAGKTTFIKKLISDVFKEEKIVLIENEFGEIGIDSRFMHNSGIQVTEMNSGCICCTLVGDFARALNQVVEEYHPDRIIIEPSGVGKLSDVAEAVLSVQHDADICIDSKITVVDGKKIKMYMKNFGEFFNNQIEHATTIVISRTQQMSESDLKECMLLLRDNNEKATVITTPWDQLNGSAIMEALGNDDMQSELVHGHGNCCHHDHSHNHHEHEHRHNHEHHHHDHEHHHDDNHHHDHHHADEVFGSWGTETVHKFNRIELEDTLKMFSTTNSFGNILRAKGIVECEGGQWIEFDMVPEEVEIRECQPDYTGRVCVIGTDLDTEYLSQTLGN